MTSIPRYWALFMLLAGAALLAPLGCAGPTFIVAQYEGPPRPRESIAVIRMQGSDPVQVVSVDGEPLAPVESDVRLHIEVLPGEHSVGIANFQAPDQPAQRVRFIAEAGKLYGATWQGPDPRVFELDASSGRTVRDVSLTKREPPPEEAPHPAAPPPPAEQPAPQPEPSPAPPVEAAPPAAPPT